MSESALEECCSSIKQDEEVSPVPSIPSNRATAATSTLTPKGNRNCRIQINELTKYVMDKESSNTEMYNLMTRQAERTYEENIKLRDRKRLLKAQIKAMKTEHESELTKLIAKHRVALDAEEAKFAEKVAALTPRKNPQEVIIK